MAANPSYDPKVWSKKDLKRLFSIKVCLKLQLSVTPSSVELCKLIIRQLKLKESKCLSLMLANMSISKCLTEDFALVALDQSPES